ncbi:MAG: hypothetical protein ACOCZB_08925 [Spirochaetota bacterium]
MSKRLSGTKNYLYFATLGAEESGDGVTPLATEGFYKITARAASGSAWPTDAVVGDIVYNGTGAAEITPETGDDAKPITLTKVAWVKDIPNSASKQKFDDTTQIDNATSYEEGDKPEISGSFDGYFFSEDDQVLSILKKFFTVIEDDGAGNITFEGPSQGVIHAFLGRNETTTSGEVEIMQYLPVIVEQLTTDKPMQGKQVFNCNYTAVGRERPSFYYRTVA